MSVLQSRFLEVGSASHPVETSGRHSKQRASEPAIHDSRFTGADAPSILSSPGGFPKLFPIRVAVSKLDAAPGTNPTHSDASSATEDACNAETAVGVLVRCRPVIGPETGSLNFKASKPNSANSISLRVAGHNGGPTLMLASGCRTFRCNAFLDGSADQQNVFEHAVPVVDKVLDGYSGTIFCYGITGSGKTYTLTGPAEPPSAQSDKAEQRSDTGARSKTTGIAQRSASRIFDFVRDRAQHGEVFSVEVSFLEVCPDGNREILVDLLAEDGAAPGKLEIRHDPLNPKAFICEGLKRELVTSPEEIWKFLACGRRRAAVMETTRNQSSSRSHRMFSIIVESFDTATSSETSGQCVRRGKLLLVDLAGSESVKEVRAVDESFEDTRRKQAIGINRALAHLGTVVRNLNAGFESGCAGFRQSALTMLLKDCMGGNARALLVATVGAEIEYVNETCKTLTFAQRMMQIKNVEHAQYVEGSSSTLLQMRRRQLECLRRIREQQEVTEEGTRLQKEVAELDNKIISKKNVQESHVGNLPQSQQKMDEFRDGLSKAVSTEFAALQEHTRNDMQVFKQILEEKLRENKAATGNLNGTLRSSRRLNSYRVARFSPRRRAGHPRLSLCSPRRGYV